MISLFKMKEIAHYTLCADIKKYLEDVDEPLNVAQRNRLSEYLSERCFFEYDKEIRSSPIFRITAPLFIIVIIIMFLFMPIKWLFSGRFYYQLDNGNIIVKWGKNLGLNI